MMEGEVGTSARVIRLSVDHTSSSSTTTHFRSRRNQIVAMERRQFRGHLRETIQCPAQQRQKRERKKEKKTTRSREEITGKANTSCSFCPLFCCSSGQQSIALIV